MPSESITHKHVTGNPLAPYANRPSEEEQLNIGAKSGSLIFFFFFVPVSSLMLPTSQMF